MSALIASQSKRSDILYQCVGVFQRFHETMKHSSALIERAGAVGANGTVPARLTSFEIQGSQAPRAGALNDNRENAQ
ncbi:hypothetical protein ACLBXM_01580 [Xanthobacteraceae bacterium A53D]